MRHRQAVLIASALSLWTLSARAAHEPLLLMDPPIPNPVWVDSSAVLDKHGKVAGDIFHPAVARALETLLNQPSGATCIQVGRIFKDYAEQPSRATLRDTVRTVQTAVLTKVVGASYGFYADTPGTLLHLRLVSKAKGNVTRSRLFAFVPVGDFVVGDKRICKTDPRFGDTPVVGDELLILTYPPRGEHRELLLVPDEGNLIVIHDGNIRYPARYAESSEKSSLPLPQSRADLLRFVQREVGRAETEQ